MPYCFCLPERDQVGAKVVGQLIFIKISWCTLVAGSRELLHCERGDGFANARLRHAYSDRLLKS